MTKGSSLVVLMLLIGSSLILPASSQEQVSQTVYVYDGDFNGTLLSGVQVAGQDAAGKSFSGRLCKEDESRDKSPHSH